MRRLFFLFLLASPSRLNLVQLCLATPSDLPDFRILFFATCMRWLRFLSVLPTLVCAGVASFGTTIEAADVVGSAGIHEVPSLPSQSMSNFARVDVWLLAITSCSVRSLVISYPPSRLSRSRASWLLSLFNISFSSRLLRIGKDGRMRKLYQQAQATQPHAKRTDTHNWKPEQGMVAKIRRTHRAYP